MDYTKILLAKLKIHDLWTMGWNRRTAESNNRCVESNQKRRKIHTIILHNNNNNCMATRHNRRTNIHNRHQICNTHRIRRNRHNRRNNKNNKEKIRYQSNRFFLFLGKKFSSEITPLLRVFSKYSHDRLAIFPPIFSKSTQSTNPEETLFCTSYICRPHFTIKCRHFQSVTICQGFISLIIETLF